jgi:RNA 2',3'-cyclic 3'-phosphodiesterase
MSRGATARLFVAVDPPPAVREELAEWARSVAVAARAVGSSRGALRLLDGESLHLTLCFLGSRPVGEIEALSGALTAAGEHTCELSLGAPLWLPPWRPQALAAEIHDHGGELEHVQQALSVELASVSSWQPERRRFRPHITVARLRRGGRGRRSRAERSAREGLEQSLPATPRLSFTPQAVVLYRSWLSSEGASYEALASSELATAGR